jgi:hypothetical protein
MLISSIVNTHPVSHDRLTTTNARRFIQLLSYFLTIREGWSNLAFLSFLTTVFKLFIIIYYNLRKEPLTAFNRFRDLKS